MKIKAATKQKKASREYSIVDDLRGEFEDVLDDSFLNEEAFAMCEEED